MGNPCCMFFMGRSLVGMSNNTIASVLSHFIHDEEHKHGLMIMGLPTGIGKTYGNCVMMLDEIEREIPFHSSISQSRTRTSKIRIGH